MKYFLKDSRFDRDVMDCSGSNILHYAALSGSCSAMQKAIVATNIDPRPKADNEINVLHFAALSGSKDAMQQAVNFGIEPKSTSKNGRNALHYAAMSGSIIAM